MWKNVHNSDVGKQNPGNNQIYIKGEIDKL